MAFACVIDSKDALMVVVSDDELDIPCTLSLEVSSAQGENVQVPLLPVPTIQVYLTTLPPEQAAAAAAHALTEYIYYTYGDMAATLFAALPPTGIPFPSAGSVEVTVRYGSNAATISCSGDGGICSGGDGGVYVAAAMVPGAPDSVHADAHTLSVAAYSSTGVADIAIGVGRPPPLLMSHAAMLLAYSGYNPIVSHLKT